jgi:hypothetical protein
MRRMRLLRYAAPALVLLLVGMLVGRPLVAHASGGTWATTGSMNLNRIGHTATLLPNGKVLVAGGISDPFQVIQRSAELYDPNTGTWSTTGSMSAARWTHTATLLPNGDVLVAGGNNLTEALSSAEVYDPHAGTWSATSSMSVARGGRPIATLLSSGKVLVAGGVNNGTVFRPLASAELYDPVTGDWSATGAMSVPRVAPIATLLPNGDVLVAGGNSGLNAMTTSSDLYDPSTGIWSATGSMSVARYGHTATLLPSGDVLVAGGFDTGTTITASAERYTPPDASSQISRVMSLVNSLALATGLHTSLDAKLQAAIAAIRAGDTATACGTLRAFTNEVRAQSGTGLTTSQANQLLDEVTRIQSVLGC